MKTIPTDKSEVAIKVENYDLKSRLANADRVLERLGYRHCDIPACNCNSYHRWKEESDQLADLRAQVERLHADGAVMRGALEKCHRTFLVLEEKEGFSTPVAPNIALQAVISISTALSTDAGRDLLARYREKLDEHATLLALVKELEVELEREQTDHQNLADEAQRVEEVRLAQLHQRDTALNAARVALEQVLLTYDERDIDHLKTSDPRFIAGEITADSILVCHHALSQIQALQKP